MVVDHYGSFTYNVVQYLGELGADVTVVRNDELDVPAVRALAPDRIVISPGPWTPSEAGRSMAVIRELAGELPTLGIGLGHQAIGQVSGAAVVQARRIMHGKTSLVHHRGSGVFRGLPSPFQAARYHSLVLSPESWPECLEITAWTEHDDGSMDEIMAVRHRQWPVEGVQFHPESILTQHGHQLLTNFLQGGVPG